MLGTSAMPGASASSWLTPRGWQGKGSHGVLHWLWVSLSPEPPALHCSPCPQYTGGAAQPGQDMAVLGQLGEAFPLTKPHRSSPGSCSVTLGNTLSLTQRKGIQCLLLCSTSPR